MAILQLNADNYYSPDANMDYFSASQIKDFMKCPAATMAELRGEYVKPVTSALLIGGYVDACFEGTLDQYMARRPEMFTRTGTLRAEYRHAQVMYERAKADKVFYDHMCGDKQLIMCGEIHGVPFKAKMDAYVSGLRIVDLKTVKDFKPQYKPGAGLVSFIEAWNYDLQLGIYQRLEGNKLPCYIAGITKEAVPDIDVIEVPQHYMDAAMAKMLENLPYYDAIKRGLIEPPRCGKCDYCKSTKVLTGPRSIEDFERNETNE